jgi:hypothetical protein
LKAWFFKNPSTVIGDKIFYGKGMKRRKGAQGLFIWPLAYS